MLSSRYALSEIEQTIQEKTHSFGHQYFSVLQIPEIGTFKIKNHYHKTIHICRVNIYFDKIEYKT